MPPARRAGAVRLRVVDERSAAAPLASEVGARGGDIAALPWTYQYIDGAFRVDTRRVLELLGGTALYSTRSGRPSAS